MKIDIKRLLCRQQEDEIRDYLTEIHYSSTPQGTIDHHRLTFVSVQVDLLTAVGIPCLLQNTQVNPTLEIPRFLMASQLSVRLKIAFTRQNIDIQQRIWINILSSQNRFDQLQKYNHKHARAGRHMHGRAVRVVRYIHTPWLPLIMYLIIYMDHGI